MCLAAVEHGLLGMSFNQPAKCLLVYVAPAMLPSCQCHSMRCIVDALLAQQYQARHLMHSYALYN